MEGMNERSSYCPILRTVPVPQGYHTKNTAPVYLCALLDTDPMWPWASSPIPATHMLEGMIPGVCLTPLSVGLIQLWVLHLVPVYSPNLNEAEKYQLNVVGQCSMQTSVMVCFSLP